MPKAYNRVGREALIGYRVPSNDEVSHISNYYKKHSKMQLSVMFGWMCFTGLMSFGLFLNLLINISNLSSNLICPVFFLIFCLITVVIWINRKNKKVLFSKVYSGNFEVLDCKLYDVEFSIELTGEAIAKIYNRGNQYCESSFLIDEGTARKYKSGADIDVLLLKCGDFYELFSNEKWG